jgi:hypothetical protein
MKNPTIVAILCAAMPFLHACGCAGAAISEVRPGPERTLNLGASFAAEYLTGGTCSGHLDGDLVHQDMRWWTVDTLVVRVDSASGTVTAIGRGDARVWMRPPGSPEVAGARAGEILVHVY